MSRKRRYSSIIPVATLVIGGIAFVTLPFTTALCQGLDWNRLLFNVPRKEELEFIHSTLDSLSSPEVAKVIAIIVNGGVALHMWSILRHTVLVAENYQALSSPMFLKLYLVFYAIAVGSVFLGAINGLLMARAFKHYFPNTPVILLNWIAIFTALIAPYHLGFEFFKFSGDYHKDTRSQAVNDRFAGELKESDHIY